MSARRGLARRAEEYRPVGSLVNADTSFSFLAEQDEHRLSNSDRSE